MSETTGERTEEATEATTPGSRPRHVAIVMDGNGRWAAQRGLMRSDGHRRGADAVRATVRAARELGLEALTLYAFSMQNWQRPAAEVQVLMELLAEFVRREWDEILGQGIRLTTIGELGRLPPGAREPLSALIAESARNRGMTLCLALSYGARESIVAAARALAERVRRGELDVDAIDEARLGAELATAELPPLDLLVRTSGEQRLSNFLLWEASYAELYFTEVLWPDFDRAELERALAAFAGRQRRFGRVEPAPAEAR